MFDGNPPDYERAIRDMAVWWLEGEARRLIEGGVTLDELAAHYVVLRDTDTGAVSLTSREIAEAMVG